MRRVWFALAAFGLCGSAAATACAQPPLSAEVTGGLAQLHGGEFRGRSQTGDAARLQASIPLAPSTWLLLGGTFERYHGSHAIIMPAGGVLVPGGSSTPLSLQPAAPNLDYTGFEIGLRRRVREEVDIGFDAGIGTTHARGSVVGWGRGLSGDADVAAQVVGPLHAFLRTEILRSNAGAKTLDATSLSIGLRIN